MAAVTLSEIILLIFSMSVGWNSSELRGVKRALQDAIPILRSNTETSERLLSKLSKDK